MLKRFNQYPWPGNVRELQHTIESLVVLSTTEAITPEELPSEFSFYNTADSFSSLEELEKLPLIDAVETLEIRLIQAALDNSSSAAEAAKNLGIDPSTLSKKRKKYGI